MRRTSTLGSSGMPSDVGWGPGLNEAGVHETTIQSILRHAVSTTMAYCLQPDRAAGERGPRKLSDVLQKKYKIKV